MKEKKANKNFVKDVLDDPTFYNEQVGINKEPMQPNMQDFKINKHKK